MVEVEVESVPVEEVEVKPKAFIHWVANPLEIEVHLYERLFKHSSTGLCRWRKIPESGLRHSITRNINGLLEIKDIFYNG